MSLGLDALNKLQRLRAEDDGGRMPAIFPPPRGALQPAKSPANRWLATGMVVSLGIAAAALCRSGGKTSIASAPTSPAAIASAANVPSAPALTAPVTIIVPNTGYANPGPGGRTTPIQGDAVEASVSAAATNVTSIANLPDETAPTPHSPAATAPAAAGNPLVTSFVAGLKVGGVDEGSSSQNPVAMLNDSICHVNDTVSRALGIRLIGIQSTRLTFEDTHGVRYVKNIFPI